MGMDGPRNNYVSQVKFVDYWNEDPWNSRQMIDTKNTNFQIFVRTNFREVSPDFI